MKTPNFRDMDGTTLQYGDTVVIVYGGLPISKLVRGEVDDIGTDYVEIVDLDNKERIWVYKSEQILFLF